MLDATSGHGVALQRWSNIKNYLVGNATINQFYEQIIYRKVVGERDDPMIDKLEVFLREVVGRQYGISTTRLLFPRKSIKNLKGSQEEFKSDRQYVPEDRKFFCSELVAKAFKVLGIIEDDDKACSSYFPSSFSSKGQSSLKFTRAADKTPLYSMDPELNIVVDMPSKSNRFQTTQIESSNFEDLEGFEY